MGRRKGETQPAVGPRLFDGGLHGNTCDECCVLPVVNKGGSGRQCYMAPISFYLLFFVASSSSSLLLSADPPGQFPSL